MLPCWQQKCQSTCPHYLYISKQIGYPSRNMSYVFFSYNAWTIISFILIIKVAAVSSSFEIITVFIRETLALPNKKFELTFF